MSTLRKITLSFVALLLLVSSVGMNTSPAVKSYCSKRHTVGSRESLETIAMKYNKSVRTLMALNNIPNQDFIFAGQKLCIAAYGVKPGQPLVLITNTVRDASVTLKIMGFPKKEKLEVYMGPAGSMGRNGIKVANPTADNNGAVEVTVEIPAQLRGQARLSVRAQTTKANQYAFHGFNNITSVPGGYSEMPAARVTGWVYNKSVDISLVNAPAGVTYKVMLVSSARRGTLHMVTSTITTGAGGSISATIKLPKSLKGNQQAYILLQDANSGSFAYATYTNK